MFTIEELKLIKSIAISKEYNLLRLQKELEKFECYKQTYPFLETEIKLHISIKDKCIKLIAKDKTLHMEDKNENKSNL